METYKTDLLDLRCCDNMDLMAKYPDKHFDLAVVDPPYRDSNQPTKDMRASGSMKSLEGRPSEEYFKELVRVSKEQIIWGANNFQLPQFKGFFVWDKGIPFDFTMSMAEIASLSDGLGTISKIWKFRIAGSENRIHPTQKPVKLYEKLLMTYAKKGNKILDTHLGSGSIAVASHYAGLHLTACEIDEHYFRESVSRIKRETAQQSLF